MLILAIDPGKTTGVALIKTEPKIKLVNLWSFTDFKDVLKLVSQVNSIDFTLTIYEDSPSGGERDQLNRCWELFDFLDNRYLYEYFSPSQWKPFIRAVQPQTPVSAKNQHEKDAYLMLFWYLIKEKFINLETEIEGIG